MNNIDILDNGYSDLWNFVSINLPNYYVREDVLWSDVLRRFLDNECIEKVDLDKIRDIYGLDKKNVIHGLLKLENAFITEALNAYYGEYLARKEL